MTRRTITLTLGAIATVFAALQLTNPERTNPVAGRALHLEAQTSVPANVAATLRRACYDCHSNDTTWPWYARVAPASWLVVHDVNEGRGQMNFSRWGEYDNHDRADMLDEACSEVRASKMPLPPYLVLHGEARLSAEDVQVLCAWAGAEAARLTAAQAHP